MHNSDITVGASVSFGYTLMNATGTPDSFTLCNYRIEKTDGFNVTLPTIQQCINFASKESGYPTYLEESLSRFIREQAGNAKGTARSQAIEGALRNHRILPILSDPTKKDTSGDGISDFDSPKPLVHFRGPIAWDVWGSIDGAEWMRKRGITEMVFLGEHDAFFAGNPFGGHASIIMFIVPWHSLNNSELFNRGTNSEESTVWGNIRYATIGGSSADSLPFTYLHGIVNSKKDVELDRKTSMKLIHYDIGMVNKLIQSNDYFNVYHRYELLYDIIGGVIFEFPLLGIHVQGYNSNSYARSILRANGLNPRPHGNLPGWYTTIDESYFWYN
jgi:hypothetical protein